MAEPSIGQLILDTPLCVGCLVMKSGVPAVAVINTLRRIEESINLVSAHRSCHECQQGRMTYLLNSHAAEHD